MIEQISSFHASGEMDCELITVEGENSAMNAVMAASLAGARVFTASSSWGLVFMYDAVLATAGARAPVVMVNVNRETPGIIAVSSGQQDMISTRDAGWIFLIAENCQEILDLVLQSYRLAEDYDIQVPVMVHYDGFSCPICLKGGDPGTGNRGSVSIRVEIPAQTHSTSPR